MATTIKLKNGSGAPLAGDLVQGEPALDLTNKRLYTENASGTVIEVGTNPSTLTVDGNVGIGTASPQQMLHLSGSVPEIRYTDTTGNEYRAGNNNGKFRIYDQTAASDRLVIDGSGNVGIGEASPDSVFHVNSGTGNNTAFFESTDNGAIVSISDNAGSIQLRAIDTGDFVVQVGGDGATTGTNSTEAMRIDSSGNVGIGTASPSTSLDVVRAGAMPLRVQSTSGTECQINMVNTSGNVQLEAHSGNFTIDADNVGIGTTSPNYPLHLNKSDSAGCWAQFTNSTTGTGSGAGALVGIDSNEDFRILQYEAKALALYTSATERMRIDSSGKVGIGTTSPDNKFHVVSGSAGEVAQFTGEIEARGLSIRSETNTDASAHVVFNSQSGGSKGMFTFETDSTERMRIDSSGAVIINQSAGSSDNTIVRLMGGTAGYSTLQFADSDDLNIGMLQYNHSTNALAFNVNDSERMSISSSGHVTVKPSGRLYLESSSGFSPYLLEASNGLTINTSSTERMRIDSSGALLIGRTSGNPNSSSFGINFDGGGRMLAASNYGATGTAHQFYGNAGSARILGDGDLENTNNSYTGLSDARLKSNIVDASSQIDDIMAVQVRSYTLNETGATHIGVVAQELEASGMSGLVKTKDDGMKSVKYSILYMKAIKALQEAVTRIETLETEVAALKGA